VSVGVQNDFGNAGRLPTIDGLLQANGIKRIADGFVAKDFDGGNMVASGQDSSRITCGNKLIH
jgi:hypothetical protein